MFYALFAHFTFFYPSYSSLLALTKSSLESLGLNCDVSKRFAKIVLRSVASSVSSVSNYWNYEFLVLLIICKDLLEAI